MKVDLSKLPALLAGSQWDYYFWLICFGGFTVLVVALLRWIRLRTRQGGGYDDSTLRKFAAKHDLFLVTNANDDDQSIYEGKCDGLSVKLRAGPQARLADDRKRGQASSDFVSVAVQCTRPMPRGLQFWRETKVDSSRKQTRQLNEVEIGDSELDTKLIIRGALGAEIKALLTTPQVRQEVLGFFNDWPESIVTDHWVRCEQSHVKFSEELISKMLQSALALTKELDRAAG